MFFIQRSRLALFWLPFCLFGFGMVRTIQKPNKNGGHFGSVLEWSVPWVFDHLKYECVRYSSPHCSIILNWVIGCFGQHFWGEYYGNCFMRTQPGVHFIKGFGPAWRLRHPKIEFWMCLLHCPCLVEHLPQGADSLATLCMLHASWRHDCTILLWMKT